MTEPWSNQNLATSIVVILGVAGSGVYIYDPSNNLVGSWVGIAGTDPIDGISVPSQMQLRTGDGSETNKIGAANVTINKASGALAAPFIQVSDQTVAAPNSSQINPTNIQTPLAQLNELAAAPGAGVGFGQLYADAGGWLATIDPQGMKGQLMAQQAVDFTTHTVTQSTPTALSTSFNVPAGDAVAPGAAWELEAAGTGTNGSTVQSLTVNLVFGGTNQVNFTFPLTGAISNPLGWRVCLRVECVTTGVTGTWLATIWGTLSAESATALSNTAVNMTSAAFTRDTTIAEALVLQANWGSTTGAPTVTCRRTGFRRVA